MQRWEYGVLALYSTYASYLGYNVQRWFLPLALEASRHHLYKQHLTRVKSYLQLGYWITCVHFIRVA